MAEQGIPLEDGLREYGLRYLPANHVLASIFLKNHYRRQPEKFHILINMIQTFQRCSRMFSTEVDDLDRHILGFLQDDAGVSFADISRKLGVAEATVRFRVKRLLRRGIIIKFAALVDPSKVGFPVSGAILLKIDPVNFEQASKKLISLKETRYLFQSTGEYDMVAVVFAHDIAHLNQLVREAKMISGVKDARVSATTLFLKFDPTFEL